jgi:hypothetical protein
MKDGFFEQGSPYDLFSVSHHPAGQKKIRGRPLILAPTAGAGASRAITRQTPDYRLSQLGSGFIKCTHPNHEVHMDRSG